MSRQETIDCPYCGEPADIGPSNPYRPFCSRRCKLIDLGDWLDESNRISDVSGPDTDTGGMPDDSNGQPPH